MGQTQSGGTTPRASPPVTPADGAGSLGKSPGYMSSVPKPAAVSVPAPAKVANTRDYVAENFQVSFPPSPSTVMQNETSAAQYNTTGGRTRGVVGGSVQMHKEPGNVNDGVSRPVDTQRLMNDPSTILTPTVFTWNHGGHNVYLTGSFNAWQDRLPMHRSGNDFTYILELPPGNHQYKFVVDNDWMCAPDQQTVRDDIGNVNNLVEVTVVRSSEAEDTRKGSKHAQLAYGNYCPSRDEMPLKEPPQLPPHLKHVVLNCAVNLNDPTKVPLPQHVTLDHLYCASRPNDGTEYTLIGVSQRYQNKFVTTIYYKPNNVPLPVDDVDDAMDVDM